jgi:hypothetical protein
MIVVVISMMRMRFVTREDILRKQIYQNAQTAVYALMPAFSRQGHSDRTVCR